MDRFEAADTAIRARGRHRDSRYELEQAVKKAVRHAQDGPAAE
ncbi:hypothetical protein [Streptomyces sp. NPDC046870]